MKRTLLTICIVAVALYGLISDIHASERPPSSCTETYCDDLLELLARSVLVARERKLRAMVWAGDIFHSKVPGRTSHRPVGRVSAPDSMSSSLLTRTVRARTTRERRLRTRVRSWRLLPRMPVL